jgi:hypothetical protein
MTKKLTPIEKMLKKEDYFRALSDEPSFNDEIRWNLRELANGLAVLKAIIDGSNPAERPPLKGDYAINAAREAERDAQRAAERDDRAAAFAISEAARYANDIETQAAAAIKADVIAEKREHAAGR